MPPRPAPRPAATTTTTTTTPLSIGEPMKYGRVSKQTNGARLSFISFSSGSSLLSQFNNRALYSCLFIREPYTNQFLWRLVKRGKEEEIKKKKNYKAIELKEASRKRCIFLYLFIYFLNDDHIILTARPAQWPGLAYASPRSNISGFFK